MNAHIHRRGKGPMIRISLPYIYKLAVNLEPVGRLEVRDTPAGELWLPCVVANGIITELIEGSLYGPHLRASFDLAHQLKLELNKIVAASEGEETISQYQIFRLKQVFEQYKTVLMADLGILGAYFVLKKGGFDTETLLSTGEELFPAELADRVPEAIFDAREAAKCLAFENATAAGFHLFRVLEAVLRRYYSEETRSATQPKVRNIAVYVNAMRQAKKGDEKVLFLVREISDRFRNPLIHPDVVLTVNDAIAIHGLVRTAVNEMLKALPDVAQTTATAVIP